MTKIPSVEKEILKWMNAYIPEGKTIPVFEDMLEQYATTQRTALLTELKEWADSRIKPQEHGPDCLGEFCDSAFCNWEDIYKTNTEMALLKAHLDELINSTK